KNDTSEPNQTISYVRWNYSVTAAPCPAVQQPTIGEENATVQESELNVTCYAQPTTDLSRNLVYIVASALGLTVIIELVLHFIRSRRKWSPQKRSD
ncbi:MAG: hypothetical protein QW112_02775, partial [Candidatus Micrarchaeia archaeon]